MIAKRQLDTSSGEVGGGSERNRDRDGDNGRQ